MCLVRSSQASSNDLSISGVQKNNVLSDKSHDKESQQEAMNHHQEIEFNKRFSAKSSEFESRQYREMLGHNEISHSTPVPCPSKIHSSNSAIASSSTTKLKNEDEKSMKGKRSHRIIVVEHNYHDHSRENKGDRPRQQKSRGGVSIPFPLKLHKMLDRAMVEGHGDVVSWQPHGRCFVIYKLKDFQDIVLPKYFKLSKISSFQRQLNLYGFQRLTIGRDRGGYYHELFLRNKEFLAYDIKRVQVKGTGVRARSNPEQEPNFWAMQWCDPKVVATSTEDEIEVTNSMVSSFNTTRMTSTLHSAIYQRQLQAQTIPTICIPNSIQPMKTAMQASSVSSMNGFYEFSMSGSNNTSTRHHESYGSLNFSNGVPNNGNKALSFGDKTFHLLDPFQPISLEDHRKIAKNENGISSLDAGRLEHMLK